MRLGISTGALWPSGLSKRKAIRFIHSLRPEVQGIELLFARPLDLINFMPGSKVRRVLCDFEFVSVHYPFAKHILRSKFSERKTISAIEALDKIVPIKHVVLHPHCAGSWRNFGESRVAFLVENAEKGPWFKGFQTPGEMQALMQKTGFGMCLDLNHAMSCGIAPKKFLRLRKRIKQVHVNSTDAFGIDAKHRLVCESSGRSREMVQGALGKLGRSVWMLEPSIFKRPKERLESEIMLMERLWKGRQQS